MWPAHIKQECTHFHDRMPEASRINEFTLGSPASLYLTCVLEFLCTAHATVRLQVPHAKLKAVMQPEVNNCQETCALPCTYQVAQSDADSMLQRASAQAQAGLIP